MTREMSRKMLEIYRTSFAMAFFLVLGCSWADGLQEEERTPSSVVASLNNQTTLWPIFSSSNRLNGSAEVKKVCRGTSSGLGHMDDQYERYLFYKTLYTNCTHVDGNLEIVFLGNQTLDLSFLQNIREIAGYVLIVANYVDYVPLTSLRIIRGRTLFEIDGNFCSLYVALNFDPGNPNVGLKELRLSSLHEILAGNVVIFNNINLCFHDTIDWKDIVTGDGSKVTTPNNATRLRQRHKRTCGKCDESCNGRCWGEGPEYCQELTRISCSQQCDGRCFGNLPNQCCHSECAGGCNGPSNSQCWACKNFDNEGMCENFCPPEYVYSPQEYRQVPNPNVKYAYGSLCVDKCPTHLIADKGACVQDCGTGRVAGKDGKCVECDGPCPKICQLRMRDSDFINADNINNYTGCTIIQGSIKILEISFKGDPFNNVGPMRPQQLSLLKTVQEVTDFVQIQASDGEFRDLSFLSNLRVIHGRKLDSGHSSLQIFKTSLETLNLESLEEIRFGHIYIANNSRLCYANTVKWEKIRARIDQRVIIDYNRNSTFCALDNEVCSMECTDDGCWGPLDHQCLSCKNFHLEKRCLQTCNKEQGMFTSGIQECQTCHPECMEKCDGPGPDRCDRCKNVRDGPYCVSACPPTKYRDENGVCQPCHPNCDEGCTGPLNTVGPGGCSSCALAVYNGRSITACLPKDSPCGDGFYKGKISSSDPYPQMVGKRGCMKCHPECATCTGQGISFCETCIHYKQENKCVSKCSSDYFLQHEQNECLQCDSQCLSCNGPTASDCIDCKLYKIYENFDNREANPQFNCTEKCPEFAPFLVTDEVLGEIICVAEDSQARQRNMVIGFVSVIPVALLLLILVFVVILCLRRTKAKESTQKLANRLNEIDEAEPLKPTNAKPDLSQLRLVNEYEIKCKGYILGSGAFGTVYKAFWCPPGKTIAVAIKVLQERSSGQSKDFLDEARIMCSVDHPCCVRILGICLSAQMMLITELMPLGCLLEFIRIHKDSINSAMLLNWCKQIAQGMNHLESHGIVHCDLAARNVLVANCKQIKITDFGLAKMIEYGQDHQYVAGRQLPYRWLAIEGIRDYIFTHKSDVWSLGVTMWELFTFGERPFESVPPRELIIILERGERLRQPSICTFNTYMLLNKCWMANPDDRPTFLELIDILSKMELDPLKYLQIPNDEHRHLPDEISESADHAARPRQAASEDYLQPKKKSTGSVRYTKQPSAILVNGHGPKARLSDPKPSLKSDSIEYETMSPVDVRPASAVDQQDFSSHYIDLLDGDSGGVSGVDEDSLSSLGPEYIPMSLLRRQAVTNPEYFDSSSHDNLAKSKSQHPELSGNRMFAFSRMDSVGCTESERSSVEESSDHDYYNFYHAPRPLSLLKTGQ